MSRRRIALVCATIFCLAPASAFARTDKSILPVFDVPIDGKVTFTVDGRPVTALVTPGMPSNFYVSRKFAVSAFGEEANDFVDKDEGFKLISIKRGTGARIGPVEVKGKLRPVTLGFASRESRTRISWFETDAYPLADALAGPYAVPASIVRFTLRPPHAGETVFSLPLARKHSWWLATTPKTFGDKEVVFAFAPHFKHSVASAAAGAVIATSLGGTFAGDVRPVEISHGVQRPARPVKLARPLQFGSIRIDDILVRTRDYGNTLAIADPDKIDPSEADDGIVVTGKRRRSRPAYVVYLGADALGGCSSIIYDKSAELITLSCRQAEPDNRSGALPKS